MVEFHRYIKSTLLSRKPKQNHSMIGFIAIGAIALMTLIYWSSLFGLGPYMPATRSDIFEGKQYWRLFTALGAHADMQHLLSNSLGFGLFSYLLYDYFGFKVFPVATVFLGAAVNAAAIWTYEPQVRLLGASGMVYLMTGIWLTLYLLVERRLTFGNRLMRCLGFSLVVLMPSTFEQAVSYRTHAIGFVVGITFGLIYFFIYKKDIRKYERWATEIIEPLDPIEQTAEPTPTPTKETRYWN